MLINPENEEIISLAFEKGKVHNFQLFKSSQIHLKPGVQLTADSDLSRTYKVAREFRFAEKVYQKSPLIEARSKTEQKYLEKTYRG